MATNQKESSAMSTPTNIKPAAPGQPSGQPLEAAQPQCTFMVPTGTENNGQKVLKQCVKHLKADGQPHDGEHSLRVYAKIDTSKIKLENVKAEAVPTDETVEGLTERTRDELQQSIDADVLAAHKLWTEKGKLTGFNEVIKAGAGQRYFIEPDEGPAFRALLRRAESFHNTNGVQLHVRVIPPKRHKDGRTMLYWIAVDKREMSDEDKAKAAAKRAATKAAKEAAAKAAEAEATKANAPKPGPRPSQRS